MGYAKDRTKGSGKKRQWQALAYLDGKHVSVGTYDTKAEAEGEIEKAEYEHRHQGGSTYLKGRIKFKQWVPQYLAAAQLEATTRAHYEGTIRRHLMPVFGEVPLGEIDVVRVGRFLNKQVEAGASVRTRVASRSVLGSVLKMAVLNGVGLTVNPVAATKAPKRTLLERRRVVLRPEQWPALRREFNDYGPETQLLIDLEIDTGLRYGELTDLRAGHFVDRDDALPHLTVQTAVIWPGARYTTNGDVVERKDYTKGGTDRSVDLSPAMASTLREHIKRHHLSADDLIFNYDRLKDEHFAWRSMREAEKRVSWEAEWQTRLAAAGPVPTERYVTERRGKRRTGAHGRPNTFSLGCRCDHCTYANLAYGRDKRLADRLANPDQYLRRGPKAKGRPEIREPWLSPQWFRDTVWHPARQRAGLEWLHFHDLRHAHASWLLAAGVPVRSVSKRLGHKNLATTEIYLHSLVDVDDIAKFMGTYHDIFAAALRGELWDLEAESKPGKAGPVDLEEFDVDTLAELMRRVPRDQLAAAFAQVLSAPR